MRFAASVALSLLLAGCGSRFGATDFRKLTCTPAQDTDSAKVEVRYLGSGGVAIHWRGDAILLGPAFSNPSLLRAGVWRGGVDLPRIRTALGRLDHMNVRAVFAAHSHYDHIGDFPAVGAMLPGVPLYVNASGANMLDGEPDLRSRVHTLHANEPIPVGNTMIVRPIISGHAPQLCPWNIGLCRYAADEVTEKWKTPIAGHRLRSMRGGQTYAFVIELLGEDDTTRYRIYYNDAAAPSPLGQTAGPFDLAILCIAQWNWVRDYPRDLLAVIQPRHVLVSHWDNFFSRAEKQFTFVPFLWNGSAERFRKIVEEKVTDDDAGPSNDVCGEKRQRVTMAVPGSSMLFASH